MSDLKEIWRVWTMDPLELALFLLFSVWFLRAVWNLGGKAK